ncbi:MAG: hypothetical protein ABIQ95_01540 [Bdellovibrionia bacterium]
MKIKRQGKTKKKNLPTVRKTSKTFWAEIKKIAQNHVSKGELFRMFGHLNSELNALLKKEFPSVKVYIKRTQRKVDRFFIRQNRLGFNKAAHKMDVSAKFS